MAWPKEVDVVEAKDICRRTFELGSQHCIIGWLNHWFSTPGVSSRNYLKSRKVAQQIIGTDALMGWNDDTKNSKAKIARTLNEVTAALGYTENNPSKIISVEKEIEILSVSPKVHHDIPGTSLWVTLKRTCFVCRKRFEGGNSITVAMYIEDGDQKSGVCHPQCVNVELV